MAEPGTNPPNADGVRAAAARQLRGALRPDAVVVWTAAQATVAAMGRRSVEAVQPSERADADRRPAGAVRDAFIGRRALRRALVAAHLDCPLSDVEIDTRCRRCGDERHGPPTVTAPPSGLHLSTSSAGAVVVVAVGPCALGVDVERRDRLDGRAAANAERATDGAWLSLCRAVPAATSAAHVWTGLESLGKGLGAGLVVSAREVEEALPRWTLTWWEPAEGTLGCVATVHAIGPLVTWGVP